ncbi:hypothetical protein LWC34_47175 [Kibdelosporangium philippinense]|uniref:Uncharacterized protein n=1 Tax=Kibdelosporangium philippinense TaxID=211113 RepID=A0ABS8ZV98_9PSEU|nr:hypothetical protein [Kibdelosporangium philippinense]MCE7010338.1 hypothetical protein [Kibdelosporangium philippinense]
MTAQVPDEVFFERGWYSLTAVDGTGLFDPEAHDLEPMTVSSSCWRGHICGYAVSEGRLLLRDLIIASEDPPPLIRKVVPVRDGDEDDQQWLYQNLEIPVAFTGRLLIGDGDIKGRPYLNMGFKPAWMYREVHELTFKAGALVDAADRSAQLAAVRETGPPTQPTAGESTADWVSRTFSLSYHYSWPT